MARKVKDQNLDGETARRQLKARGKPYYRTNDPGLHIGYRKLRGGPGKWVVRLYAGEQTYQVETIATADDLSDANGADILNYGQALNKARQLRDQRSRSDAGLATLSAKRWRNTSSSCGLKGGPTIWYRIRNGARLQ